MKLKLTSMLLFALLTGSTFAQTNQLYPEAETVKTKPNSSVPSFVKFKTGQEIKTENIKGWLSKRFKLSKDFDSKLIKSETDKLGYTHSRYQQTYMNIPVQSSMYILHGKNNTVESINGDFHTAINVPTTASLSEADALKMALNHVNATAYKWQSAGEEAALKRETKNPNATYYPQGELMIVPVTKNNKTTYYLAYRFDVYASIPMKRLYVYIDAITGKVIKETNRICTTDVSGTAVTKYSGTQTIMTNKFQSNYFLIESGRGNGIETYNLQTSTNYNNAVDFTDTDNYWDNTNAQQDEVATDAHWGAEMTYDYFSNTYSRNSIDNNGFPLISYVHYDNNFVNAFWDGQRMTYGDGDTSQGYSPLTSLDIVGHEITHGLTENTAALEYFDEAGGLNESFSDILGVAIDFYGNPTTANWLIGDATGTTFRSMSTPKDYSQPDTYQGQYWVDGGDPHLLSGVQNYWFYLLSEGGSGTNDVSNAYSITGIGLTKASAIAYRTLTYYLTPSSNYYDARMYSIQAATDLYNSCGTEVQTVTDAWYAVGVGDTFSVSNVQSNFIVSQDSFCIAGTPIIFSNYSTNAMSYFWNFGDGTTDTIINPSHTYSTTGDFTITLKATSCNGDTDVSSTNIYIGSAFSCFVSLPVNGFGVTQTSCTGTLVDDGVNSNYSNNADGAIIIAPDTTTTENIILKFQSFDLEDGYDTLFVYDYDLAKGKATLIGGYTGNNLPNGGTIYSSAKSVAIELRSDPYVNGTGFKLTWQCVTLTSPPVANFTADTTNSCNGKISFFDLSSQFPNYYLWDFGDGTTDTVANPKHTYSQNGTYSVKLLVKNKLGADSLTKINYITIARPAAPSAASVNGCKGNSVTLTATGTGSIRWYDEYIGGNLLAIGNTFITPVLDSTTNYYAEDILLSSVGPNDTAIGSGGYFSNSNRYLLFNCSKSSVLVSVDVYALSNGDYRLFELKDSNGTVLQSSYKSLKQGLNKVELNFNVPVENNLSLSANGGYSGLFRNTGGAVFPYTTGAISITGTNGSANQYFYFYNWQISDGCISERNTVQAIIDTASIVTITANKSTTLCTGDSLTLTASPGSSYLWSTGDTTNSITVSSAGKYAVTVTNFCGKITSDSTEVIIVTPTASITASQTTPFCQGDSVMLTANTSASYQWSNGDSTQSITVKSAGIYTVTTTDSNNCSATSSADTVTVNSLPTALITASGTTTFCQGDSVILTADTVANVKNYTWSNGATTQSITVNSAGTYYVIVTDTNGCSATSASVSVTVKSAPSATITTNGKTMFCQGGTVSLIASSGTSYSYLWSNGAVTQTTTVNTAGNYTVTVTGSNGCSKTSAPTTVTVNPLPTPNITANGATTFCQGKSVILTADTASSYKWNTGATTQSITATLGANYTVTSTDVNGCINTSSATTVTVNPLPTASITAGSSTTFCIGNTVTLTASPAVTYLWSSGDTTQSVVADSSANYTVTVTDINGCIKTSSTKIITVNPLPTASITASGATTFCQGGSVVLTAGTANYYKWSNGGSTQSITVSTSGNYSVTVTNAQNCSATSSTIQVTVNPVPTATITTGNQTTFCQGDSAILTASNGGTNYLWSNGDTTQSVTAKSSWNYTVTITDSNGCSKTSPTTIVTVNPIPTATITAGGATTFCQGGSVILTAGTSSYYKWSNGGSTQSITVSTSGNYSVTVTNTKACSVTSSMIQVTVNPMPIATVTTGNPTTFCQGDSAILTASNGGINYLWSNGDTTQSVTAKSSWNYTVIVTDSNGCSKTSPTTIVTVNPIPTATITAGGATTFCQGGSIVLTAGTSNYYKWSNGASTQSITVTTSGTYSVTVTNTKACSVTSSTIQVTVNPLPTATITTVNTTTFCQGDSAILTASNGGTNYLWSNGDTTQSVTAKTSGNYMVTVTNASGCSKTSSATVVKVNPIPTTAVITPNGATEFCQGNKVTLQSGSSSGNQWFLNGNSIASAVVSSYTANASGDYTVKVTTNGCSATSAPTTVTVNALPTATVTVSGAVTFCQGGSVVIKADSVATAYKWNNGAITQSITANTSGNYSVTLTNAKGCSQTSATTIVKVNTPTKPTIQNNGGVLYAYGCNSGCTYQWRNNGDTIAGAIKQYYSLLGIKGYYSVTMTDANGCSSTSEPIIATGIEQISEQNSFTVFPNPNAGTFTIEEVANRGIKEISVFNMLGEKVYSESIVNQQSSIINLSAFPAGIYFIQVKTTDKTYNRKLVIER